LTQVVPLVRRNALLRVILTLLLLSPWTYGPEGAKASPRLEPDCASATFTVSWKGEPGDVADVCFDNVQVHGDGSVTADVLISNKKSVFYSLWLSQSGGVKAPYTDRDGAERDFIQVLDATAKDLGMRTALVPIAGGSTIARGRVVFPAGSELTIELSKFGEDAVSAIALFGLGLGAVIGDTVGGVDLGKTLNEDPSAGAKFSAKLLESFTNAGFDLAAASLKLMAGDYLGVLGPLSEAIEQVPEIAVQLFGVGVDQAKSVAGKLANLAKVIEVVPFFGDLALAPADTSITIRNARASTASPPANQGMWQILPAGRDVSLERPKGLAVDEAGNLYVADAGAHAILKFARGGDTLARWGRPGQGAGQFREPASVAVDRGGNVYVADSGNGRLQKLSSTGQALSQQARYTCSACSIKEQLLDPQSVAVHPDGTLVIGRWLDSVVLLSPDGQLRNSWSVIDGSVGRWGGEVTLALAPDGTVVVASSTAFGNGVRRFTLGGRLVAELTGPALGADVDGPTGVAVDSVGNVYVADTGKHRVLKLSPAGTLISQWGTGAPGTGAGQFSSPMGVAVASDGSLYVSDTGNKRLQVLRPG
jgi:DNA-binding beta-propeller fold protein YncE